jgi:hypothetical protein
MSGIRTKRVIWTVAFLGVTLAAIVMEVIAGVWHPAGTIPWTEYIATYVPWPVQLAAYVILATWLPFHFYRHDHLVKAAYARGLSRGLAKMTPNLGLATTREILDEVRARGETEVYYRELGNEMAIGAADLADKMPGSMLDYRTADGR